MSDQILDEDEVMKSAKSIGSSFWSDFKYFVWALVFGVGMVYFFVNLFYFLQKLSSGDSLINDNHFFDSLFRDLAINQTYLALPFALVLLFILTWYINRKGKEQKILKYIYGVFGMLIIYLLLIDDWLNNLILISGSGFLLGLILVCLSIFMLMRKE